MSKNLTITLSSNGQTWKFGSKTTYGIISIDGLDALDIAISTKDNAQYDGASVEGVHVGARHITTDIKIPEDDRSEDLRDWLLGFLNPHYEGIMTIERENSKRTINYRVAERHTERDDLHTPMTLVIDFLCPDPYFSGDTFSKNIASSIPTLSCGLDAWEGAGLYVEWKEFSDTVTVDNHGDLESGIDIKFKANGAVVNPQLDNLTTGEFVRVITTLKSGDILTINTNRGNKRIELNGKNISNLKDRGSSFFQIAPGQNVLKYKADDGYTNLEVYPEWTTRYMGA
ncbi:phage distal tail protein [Caproicibacterium sp. NSD3]